MGCVAPCGSFIMHEEEAPTSVLLLILEQCTYPGLHAHMLHVDQLMYMGVTPQLSKST